MRSGKIKGRSSVTYQHKLDRVKKWHAKRVKDNALAVKEGKKVKKLKPLNFYVEKLKQPTGK